VCVEDCGKGFTKDIANYVCESCAPDTYFENDMCKKCSALIENCYNCDGGATCLRCNEGFKWDKILKKCVVAAACTTGNTYYKEDTCTLCTSPCRECYFLGVEEVCTKCWSTNLLIDGKCVTEV